MTSLKRLGSIFLGVFLVALGIQVAPVEIKTALSTAAIVVFLVWLFGYIDIREIIEGKKAQPPSLEETEK